LEFLAVSFDPVHLGHLLVRQAAIEENRIGQIVFSFQQRNRRSNLKNEMTPAEIRLQLLRLALVGKAIAKLKNRKSGAGGISTRLTRCAIMRNDFRRQNCFSSARTTFPNWSEWREANELANLGELSPFRDRENRSAISKNHFAGEC